MQDLIQSDYHCWIALVKKMEERLGITIDQAEKLVNGFEKGEVGFKQLLGEK